MSAPAIVAPARKKSTIGRSVLAVTSALITNAALSLAVDQILHVLAVYPPWGEPMHEPELNALALAYRLVFGVAAGYLVAHLAPSQPARHALILGAIATTLATIGAAVAITQPDLGPAWYPIALAILSYPSIHVGVAWHERRARRA
jgi:hypothetical protein